MTALVSASNRSAIAPEETRGERSAQALEATVCGADPATCGVWRTLRIARIDMLAGQAGDPVFLMPG